MGHWSARRTATTRPRLTPGGVSHNDSSSLLNAVVMEGLSAGSTVEVTDDLATECI